MNDDQSGVLLMDLEWEPGPLSEEDKASIERGRAEMRAGLGIPHDEVMKRLGISQ